MKKIALQNVKVRNQKRTKENILCICYKLYMIVILSSGAFSIRYFLVSIGNLDSVSNLRTPVHLDWNPGSRLAN